MFSKLISSNAIRSPEHIFVSDSTQKCTYETGYKKIQLAAAWLSLHKVARIYFYAPDSMNLILGLAACDLAGIEACVINHQTSVNDVEFLLDSLGDGLLVTQTPVNVKKQQILLSSWFDEASQIESALFVLPDQEGRLIILTTGTTGTPKAALYTWNILMNQVHGKLSAEAHGWLLVYPLNHFASYQILAHAVLQCDSIVIPASRSWEDVINAIIISGVDSISATPTFWRLLIGKAPLDIWQKTNLRRITLGGEVATDDILSKLRTIFPDAMITHIYATTELGSCFSVKDGLSGFPEEYLQRPVGNVELRIIDGELFVRSKTQMLGYLNTHQKLRVKDDWIATGDLVELQNGRVHFRGRVSEVINVGGAKVHPVKVENVILQVDGILAAHVYGQSNPVTGQVVIVEVEIMDGVEEDKVKEEIMEMCRNKLGRHELPRIVKIVRSIEKRNEKITRRVSHEKSSYC
jgi:acyl-CoA synthetase (AMP-forming)/AMP-acid ligase II